MIDEKMVKKYAKDYAYCNCSEEESYAAYKAFIAGINWFLGNLWHYASKEPKKDKNLLVERIYNGEKSMAIDRANTLYDSWKTKVNRENIIRWLYIGDLLKGDNNG